MWSYMYTQNKRIKLKTLITFKLKVTTNYLQVTLKKDKANETAVWN